MENAKVPFFFFLNLSINDLDPVLVTFRTNYGIRPWREEGPKEAIYFIFKDRLLQFKFKSGSSQNAGSQAKIPGGLYG